MPAPRDHGAAPPPAFPFGRRMNLPYLMGVYLGVNAVDDAWLVVDGPDCSHFKGQFIFGKHDWRSTLYRIDGRHRIVFTGTNAQDVTGKRDGLIERTIRKAMVDEAAVVLLTSMPLCGITGAQYDRIVEGIDPRIPVLEVPGLSLRGDWLDGYAETLAALARGRVFPTRRKGRSKGKKSVAIVGHLMDRNEGDQSGNVAEMTRLLEGLGLDVAAVWPDGGGWATLDRVARAGAIVSLPYGRTAARIVAERTGAQLIETGAPCGLEGTREWLSAVGGALGAGARAAKLVDAELDRIVPRIARAVPFYFLNRGAAIFADPHLMPGLAGLCAALGMRVRLAAFMGRGTKDVPGEGGAPVTVSEPLEADLDRLISDAGLRPNDLVICNGEMSNIFRRRYAVLEFGVPSYTHHVFPDAPFLGFRGALQLIDRMAGALSLEAE